MSYFVRILSVGFLILSVATLLPVPPDAGSEDLDCGPCALGTRGWQLLYRSKAHTKQPAVLLAVDQPGPC